LPVIAAAIAIPTVAAGAVVAYGTFAPRSSLWCPVVSRGPRDAPRIALTFDDGPWPDSTPAILGALAEARATATFFVIGRNAARWPDLLARIAGQGHILANHTFDHDHFGVFRRGRYWSDQLRRTDDLIATAAGAPPRFLRPPMGFKTGHLAAAARAAGHTLVSWTRRARDGLRTTPERILARLAPAQPGDILALHDGVEPNTRRDPRPTIDALPGLLRALSERGLEPVGLDRLLALPALRTESPVH